MNTTSPWPIASSSSITANWATSSGAPSESATSFCRLEIGAAHVAPEWETPPAAPALGNGELHLWRVPLACHDAPGSDCFELLSPDERARARRFFFAENRRQFTVGRGWLRIVLGHYLQVEPTKLVFRYGARGKPYLASPHSAVPLCFNLAHTDTLALLALTRGTVVGVDVERLRPVADADAVAARCFSPRERAKLQAATVVDRSETFLRLWTAKEACAKAVGRGLDDSLAEIDVVGTETRHCRRVRLPDETGRIADCWLTSFSPGDDHLGAVAAGFPLFR